MGEHLRKADGQRVFSTEFTRATVQWILTGEKAVAEFSRELDIAPSVIRNWKRFAEAGATTAAGEAYFLYVEPAAEGANKTDGPLGACLLRGLGHAGTRPEPQQHVVHEVRQPLRQLRPFPVLPLELGLGAAQLLAEPVAQPLRRL